MAGRRRRLARALVLVAVLLALGLWIAWPSIASAALLMDLTGAAPDVRAWLPVGEYDVTTSDLQVPTRYGPIHARVYRASLRSAPALVVVPGVHGGGVEEPRLAALSRRIAAAGAVVLSTPLPDLRVYRLTTNSTDMIEDAALWMTTRADLAPTGRVGLVGVSFAGGLALVAAGRPTLADRLTAVFALGPHADLPRVIRYMCMDDGAPKTLAPPHDYGVVLMLRQSISFVVPEDQRAGLDKALVTFLDASSAEGTDKALSVRLFDAARAAESAMPEPSRSLLHSINERDVATLGKLLAPHAERIGGPPALSPTRSPATRAPVFLLHGDSDNVIPANESLAIRDYLSAAGHTQVELLLTPLLTHAEARKNVGTGDVWRLVRFWTRLWRTFER